MWWKEDKTEVILVGGANIPLWPLPPPYFPDLRMGISSPSLCGTQKPLQEWQEP